GGGLVVAGSDAAPILQFVEHALDAIAAFVFAGVVQDHGLSVGFGRDDRLDAVEGQLLADCLGILTLIGDQRLDALADHAQKRQKALVVVRLSGRQDEADRASFAIASGVDLGREAAARAAEPLLILSPFFMPTAQWCARITVLSTMCA